MHFPQAKREFEALLDYLKHYRGCDLTGYKRSTLERRFAQRMHTVKISSYQDYLKYLQSHSEESIALLDTVLINFSSFFRDREAWEFLASDIIPQIIARKQPDESIRVWSAGCAFGQEVCSLLILFAEALGIESCLERVQFYATDVDEVAIKQARQATYHANEVAGIPSDLLKKYFDKSGQGYVFRQTFRRKIVFGHHDLAKDAPMSKIDLLMCRNVLIYFNSETQAKILARFHFALRDNGFLFLGRTETLTTRRQIFTLVNLNHRVYTKRLNLEVEDILSILSKSDEKKESDSTIRQISIWKSAYEMSPFAQLVIDIYGRLIVANEQAQLLFRLTSNDWNRPFEELELGKLMGSYLSLKTFYRDRRPLTLKNIEWIAANDTKSLNLFITPVFNLRQRLLGVNLLFIDMNYFKEGVGNLNITRHL